MPAIKIVLRCARVVGICPSWSAGRCAAVDGFVSRPDAALAAGVTVDVVKTWQFRGWLDANGERRHLTARGTDVLLADVFIAERDTRRKPERSHRRLAVA